MYIKTVIIKRDILQNIQPYLASPEAIVVTGMRRVGKTTLLRDIFNSLDSANKIFLDLENPLHQKYFEDDNFERVKRTFEFLKINFKERAYIFLDEIQLAPRSPQVVKYFIDHYQVKFFLTGSASLYLKNLFSESLSGRKYVFELYPLSFKEFLKFKNVDVVLPENHKDITEPMFETLSGHFREYMEYGGFPQVVLKATSDEKKQTLQDIFTSYFQLEVERLSDFRKTHKLRDLILLLLSRIGSRLDVNQLANELGISRVTVGEYLSFLEGTYFMHTVKPMNQNAEVEIKKAAKIYVCDSGMANAIAKVTEDMLFEQAVFQNLRFKGALNYYQKKTGVEIPFVVDKKHGFDVGLSPSESSLTRLSRVAAELGLASWQVACLQYSENDHTAYSFEF